MNNEELVSAFSNALKKIGFDEEIEIHFEIPKVQDHGDLSTNIAMQLARSLKKSPSVIADEIINNIEINKDLVSKIEKAGAGFINIKFNESYFIDNLKNILSIGEEYGKSIVGAGVKVNIEYVSANPTGYLHLGHGRNACIGDTLANIYKWCGYDVTREYYFNNAGNQMNNLGKSIYARYMQIAGQQDFPFPEDGYHGEYIRTMANELHAAHGDKLIGKYETDEAFFRTYGEKWNFNNILNTLKTLGINQDVFYNENSLYTDGLIEEVIAEFRKLDLAYDKEGAIWLKLSEMGLDSDRVIVKSSGEPTYRLPDIAYHREKFRRGYDMIIDIFGSDHIATVPDVLAGVKYLGYDESKVKVIIHQFVTLSENGTQVKMSKRTGRNYTLDDLLEEVGAEVVRFFLIMRSVNTHLEFDLGLAKEQSDKNPVFYLQYAHARISSILNNLKENQIEIADTADLSLLTHSAEVNLIKSADLFPKAILAAKEKHEPMILTDYLRSFAADFHNFYHDCRILGTEESIMQARIRLLFVAKTILKNGLTILGISAPDRM